jgi:thiamine biosynthesis lipoprotein
MTLVACTDSMHLEPVMGTVVGFRSDMGLPPEGVRDAVAALHEADRIFSTWNPQSPISLLRSGRVGLSAVGSPDRALVVEVLERCLLARELTDGAFDPWAMPGGVDPTGLVKGWAAARACRCLVAAEAGDVMVNAGGDIAVSPRRDGQPWRVGIRHPAQPGALAAVLEVEGAVATSGDYERPGQLLNPVTGRAAKIAVSATVVGPELDLADALATGLAVGGRPVLERIDRLAGYDAFFIAVDGRRYATPGLRFAPVDGDGPA